jgi:hypothetical protein
VFSPHHLHLYLLSLLFSFYSLPIFLLFLLFLVHPFTFLHSSSLPVLPSSFLSFLLWFSSFSYPSILRFLLLRSPPFQLPFLLSFIFYISPPPHTSSPHPLSSSPFPLHSCTSFIFSQFSSVRLCLRINIRAQLNASTPRTWVRHTGCRKPYGRKIWCKYVINSHQRLNNGSMSSNFLMLT